MRSDEFLDKYREFEDSLEDKYSGRKRHYTSVVFEYLNDPESKPIRDKIEICREIRNLLVHSAKIDGENVVEPSAPVCSTLTEILDYVQKPKLALEYATKEDNILIAGYKQTVIKIMNIMERSGFSHVPIFNEGRFSGVFSIGTVFEYVLHYYGKPITRQTTIGELEELLPITAHIENYIFAAKTLTLSEARSRFENMEGKSKRISVIFITETGKPEESLLGMLTPWDVMGEK
jgi:predicted transcriptional regulator